ncbi:hypothetical protein BD779DRAFT_1561428 [Infundibulicybe gibba]|nr:hypothetical protein BD779DRAFT_1561428 [Infundibulicybe gibba]
MADHIPYEIWQDIVSYIPQSSFPTAMSVSRPLFNIILDMRYGDIWWIKPDNKMLRSLVRLQEPLIAKHVKHLHIRAWYVDYLLRREKLGGSRPSNWRRRIFTQRRILDAMANATQLMINLSEYDFEWRDLPLNPHTQAFLTSARSGFGAGLQKLVLCAQISKFQQLLALTDFRELHETTMEDGNAILLEYIAPFINRLSSSLSSLTISSASDATFPILSCLESLTIPALSNPATLAIIRRSSYTLKRLCLVHHFLQLDEVASIIDIASSRTFSLNYLHIEVQRLDHSLIRLLATGLPGLSSLILVYNTEAVRRQRYPADDFKLGDQMMRACFGWRVSDFGAYTQRHTEDEERTYLDSTLDEEVMRRVGYYLPNLQSYKGRGHTRDPEGVYDISKGKMRWYRI